MSAYIEPLGAPGILATEAATIRIEPGGAAAMPYGPGTSGSRSAIVASGAAAQASGSMRERVLAIAGALPLGTPAGLEVSERYRAPMLNFSNAAHACTVEVDPATGVVRILRYVVSEDCGNIINPMVVEGQIAGGVV